MTVSRGQDSYDMFSKGQGSYDIFSRGQDSCNIFSRGHDSYDIVSRGHDSYDVFSRGQDIRLTFSRYQDSCGRSILQAEVRTGQKPADGATVGSYHTAPMSTVSRSYKTNHEKVHILLPA